MLNSSSAMIQSAHQADSASVVTTDAELSDVDEQGFELGASQSAGSVGAHFCLADLSPVKDETRDQTDETEGLWRDVEQSYETVGFRVGAQSDVGFLRPGTTTMSISHRTSASASNLSKGAESQQKHDETGSNDDLFAMLPAAGQVRLRRSISTLTTAMQPWAEAQAADLRLRTGRGAELTGGFSISRTVSLGASDTPLISQKSGLGFEAAQGKEETAAEYLETQSELERRLELKEDQASHVLSRSWKTHVARTIHQDERYMQLEWPASVIVKSCKNFLARRIMDYKGRAHALAQVLKRNWRIPLAKRRLQRMKFAKQHTRTYKLLAKKILQNLLDEHFESACFKITNNWAADVLGRAFRCNRARKEFWARFDQIDELEIDIGLNMTLPLLIETMAAAFVWAEKNAAAARLQSCIRIPDAMIHCADLKEYDDFVSESAIMIQCAFRSYRAREKVLIFDTPKCHDASLVIQMAYRSYMHRDKHKERVREWEIETENAIIIQTQCRIWLAKQLFFTRELDVDWPPTYAISSSAALKVQRVFRGHFARDNLRSYVLSKFILMHTELEVSKRMSAVTLQLAWKCHQARIQRALTLHHTYSLLLSRLRTKRQKAQEPIYDQLVINDEELAEETKQGIEDEDQDDDEDWNHEDLHDSESLKRSYSLLQQAQFTLTLQSVYRAHLVRVKIKKQWGWDHVEVSTAMMTIWHKKMASKKIQHCWRSYREYSKHMDSKRAIIRHKEAIEADFKADRNLRRVLLLNKETRVRLTALEETHGTKVLLVLVFSLLFSRSCTLIYFLSSNFFSVFSCVFCLLFCVLYSLLFPVFPFCSFVSRFLHARVVQTVKKYGCLRQSNPGPLRVARGSILRTSATRVPDVSYVSLSDAARVSVFSV